MFIWVFIFLIISIIAGFFTFQRNKSSARPIAKIIFYTFLILFVISLILWLSQVFYQPGTDLNLESPSATP